VTDASDGSGRSQHPIDRLIHELIASGRVAIERQWADGTTAAGYLADLRRAARHPLARLLVYQRRGGAIAVTISSTDQVAPPGHWGPSWLPNLLVIYSADHGMMLSGYQFSDLVAVGIPEEARWLR
jgi:hypothetical protein